MSQRSADLTGANQSNLVARHGNLTFEHKEEGWKEAKWLVIPFDRPVQVGACPIVGPAAISARLFGQAVRSPPAPYWSRWPRNPCGRGAGLSRIPSSSRSAATTSA